VAGDGDTEGGGEKGTRGLKVRKEGDEEKGLRLFRNCQVCRPNEPLSLTIHMYIGGECLICSILT
jgi:hypothetical protein